MAQTVCDVTCFQEEGTNVVRQDNRCRTGHRGRNGTHACSKDGGDEQSTQTYGQAIDDEKRKNVVGLGLNFSGQWCNASLIVAVQCTTNKEKEGRDGNEQITSEECRELRVLVRLGRMVALHIVLVNAVILQINKNAVDEAYPKGTCREV